TPMDTSTVAPASEATPPGSPPPAGPRAPARPWVGAAVLLAVLAAVVGVFFLRIYPVRGYTVPIGWDQSEYLWRTTMAQEVGLSNIDRPLPSTAAPKSGRPGFPVIDGTLSSLTRAGTFRVAMVLPTVMAIIVGLAAGAFVGVALRRPWWQVAVVSLAVSLSPFMVRLMQPEGYLDNLFAAAVFMAA